MDIFVNVVNQKLHITTNIKSLVAGTQMFVRFHFNLSDGWDDLRIFAQFTQNGTAYNVYLDSENSCYLPGEIVAGTFTLMLYGSGGVVRGTTNLIAITVDENNLIANAQSVEITESLYDQLCAKVNEIQQYIEDANYEQIIKTQTEETLQEYLDDGKLAGLIIGDGSISEEKLSSDVVETLDAVKDIGNYYWKKNVSTTIVPTLGSWESIYDPEGYGSGESPIDPYSFAENLVDENNNTIIHDIRDNLSDVFANKADVIMSYGSNSLLSLTDGSNKLPIKSLSYEIEPSLDGYSALDIYRTGINVWDEEWVNGAFDTNTGLFVESNSSQTLASKNYISVVPGTTYSIIQPTENSPTIYCYDKSKGFLRKISDIEYPLGTFETDNDVYYIKISVPNYGAGLYHNNISVNYPATENEYHAYDGMVASVEFPEGISTIYGGSVTVYEDGTGELIVTDGYIASYNNEELPSTWISSEDEYAENASPTVGASVVYKLVQPIKYDIECDVITTALGENRFWNSCASEIELVYRTDTKLYTDAIESGVNIFPDAGMSVVVEDGVCSFIGDASISTATTVVESLEDVTDPSERANYIVGSDGNYQFYKYINGEWQLIAGNGAETLSPTHTIDMSGYSIPTSATYAPSSYSGKYYLCTSVMKVYYCNGTTWSVSEELVPNPSDSKDYYIKDEKDAYGHYRYISPYFVQVGSSGYSRSDMDDIIQDINSDISELASDVTALETTVENMGNMVSDVTLLNGDSTKLQVQYVDGTSSTIAPTSSFNIDGTTYNANNDSTLRFYNGEDELTDLAVVITGGSGGGGSSSGRVTINRITDTNTQCIYGDTCPIQYSVIAVDSNNDPVGSGTGTLYINNVSVLSGFPVYTSDTGAENTLDVGEYLASGVNAVKISVSVDTGGEQNEVRTKTWTVNAVNMYLEWNYTDNQVNTSAVTDYYTPYGALSKTVYTFINVDPMDFNPEVVDVLPDINAQDFNPDDVEGVDYFVGTNHTHYRYNTQSSSFVETEGTLLDAFTTTRSGVQQALTIPMQTHGSHTVVRYIESTINNLKIKTDQQVHDMIFAVSGTTTPIISASFNTTSMIQYNTVQIPIVVYDPSSPTTTVVLKENGEMVSTWTGVDRSVHYWNYSPITDGTKTLTITCGSTVKTITINVEELEIDEAEVTGYDFRFKASEFATNAAAQNWTASYTPVGSSTAKAVDITFSNNFDWINGGLHTEYDENGNLRQYFCVRAGTSMTFNYDLFGNAYDPKQYGKNFKFVFKAVNCRTYDARVLSCMDTSNGNNGVGLLMTANEATLSTVNESLTTNYYKDTYIEFETNIHPANEYRYLQFWMDGSHDRNVLYSADDGMQQVSPVGITIGSPNCDVYIYMVKAYPTYLTNENELSNFIMDAPNAYEMADRFSRNDVLNASGEIDYTKLATQNPDLRVLLLDINRMSTGKKDNVVAYTARQIYNSGGASHCWTVNNACVTIQGTSSVGYLESAGNVDINFKNGREFTSDNETFVTGQLTFDDGSTSTKGYSMTADSIPVNYMNVKVNVASSENANNACIADWYNTYQPWISFAKKKDAKARDTMEFHPGVIFIRDRSGNLFGDTTGYHLYGICDIGNSKKNTKVFHDTTNPIACCVEVANNTSLPCLMSSKTYTWNSDDEATVIENGEEQKVYEFRYVDEDNSKHVKLAENAWDRFVAFMYDHNPNLATGNALSEPVTFGSYTFKGSGAYDTSAYNSEEYSVAYLYGYGQPATNGFTAADYVSDTSGAGVCYYYIDYNTSKLYTSDGSTWAEGASLTWTPDNNSVLRGTSISTYAGTYTHDTYEYRMAYLLNHCEEYMVMDPVIYHFVFIESFLMTDNVAKNTFWSSDDLVHWEPSKDYDNDPYDFSESL